jgi:transposase
VEKHTTIAVNLSKTVFEIAVSDQPGRVCERRRLTRGQMARFFANRPPATVLLEACGSAHHWARQIEPLGHRVLLLPPHQTRRYVLRDKTDGADASALLEAHRNEQIAPVPVKRRNHLAPERAISRNDEGFGRTDTGASREHGRLSEAADSDWLPVCGPHPGQEQFNCSTNRPKIRLRLDLPHQPHNCAI